MLTRTFLFQLLGITALAALLALAPSYAIAGWSAHTQFAYAMLALFVGLSAFLFFLGQWTARATDKYLFHGVIMASVFIKMIAGLTALFVYDRNYLPINKLFIWVFLLIYVVFTAWEVTFMTRLAKTK